MIAGVDLPSAHEGERVVEPHLVDGDAVDFTAARSFRPVGVLRAVRMGAPFHVMAGGRRTTGDAGDWLVEDPYGGRRVVDAETFEKLFEEV